MCVDLINFFNTYVCACVIICRQSTNPSKLRAVKKDSVMATLLFQTEESFSF